MGIHLVLMSALSVLVFFGCDTNRKSNAKEVYDKVVPKVKNLRQQSSKSNEDCSSSIANVVSTSSSKIELCFAAPAGTDKIELYLASHPKMKKKSLVKQLPGTTKSHSILNISPGTHAFVLVKMMPSGKSITLHAQTQTSQAGLGFELDNMVREVYLVRGDIIGVKIAEEYYETSLNSRKWINRFETDADELKSGKWTVKRNDGSPIKVLKVHRFSRAVNSCDRDSPRDGDVLDVDHIFYLHLAKKVGNDELLSILGPQNVKFTFVYSDDYSATPSIHVNQIGYRPADKESKKWQRWAYVSSWAGDGLDVDLSFNPPIGFPGYAVALVEDENPIEPRKPLTENGKAIKFPLSPRTGFSTVGSSKYVHQIDLSRLPTSETERYYIKIPGVGVSYETAVSWTAVFKAYYDVMRSLFLNRYGHDVTQEFSAWGPLYPDHLLIYDPPDGYEKDDRFFSKDTPTLKENERVLRGGHHDAGDFDIRPQHTKVPKDLLATYEINPAVFSDAQFHIPESGNGVPDILDEAVWNLMSLRQLQEPHGGVRNGVESFRHPKNLYAHEDVLPYFRHTLNSGKTAKSAALFAWIARLLKPFDFPQASSFERAALRAWKFANNPKNVAGGLPGEACLLYAAGQLYALTGEQKYKKQFETYYPRVKLVRRELSGSEASSCKIGTMEFTFGYLAGSNPDSSISGDIVKKLSSVSKRVLKNLQTDFAYRHPRSYKGICAWGSCSTPMRQMYGLVWKLQADDLVSGKFGADYEDNLNGLALASDSVFGTNPLGISFVTGLGSRSPTNLLHMDSIAHQRVYGMDQGPMPGFPVYGPVSEWPNAKYYDAVKKAFYPPYKDLPYMLQDADVLINVAGREFAVHSIQAPMVRHLALLLVPGLSVPESWKPDRINGRSKLPRLQKGESVFDKTSLQIRSVYSPNNNTVVVQFSKPVLKQDAQSVTNYSLSNGVTILSALLQSDFTNVVLSTSSLKEANYVLTAKNIDDYSPETEGTKSVKYEFKHNTSNKAPKVKITLPKLQRRIVMPKSDKHIFSIDGKGSNLKDGKPRTRAVLLTSNIYDDRKSKGPLDINWSYVGKKTKIESQPVLGDPFAPETPVLFKEAGDYTFKLCVSDGQHTTCDTVDIVVESP